MINLVTLETNFTFHHSVISSYLFYWKLARLQPKLARTYVNRELDEWAKWGVDGHTHAERPWMPYHELFTDKIARLVGAKHSEVAVTHSLTTKLQILMVSFFNPKGKRCKILCEKKAFPSDQYALQSQLQFHGLNPEENLIEVEPRVGEHLIRLKISSL